MQYFELNINFLEHILRVAYVLPRPFPCYDFLAYTIPFDFCSDDIFFREFFYNCSENTLVVV